MKEIFIELGEGDEIFSGEKECKEKESQSLHKEFYQNDQRC